jgi:hypothetical protein
MISPLMKLAVSDCRTPCKMASSLIFLKVHFMKEKAGP